MRVGARARGHRAEARALAASDGDERAGRGARPAGRGAERADRGAERAGRGGERAGRGAGPADRGAEPADRAARAPERLVPHGVDIVGIRADNPGPLSLSGTNSWIVGRDPAWLVDPGPALAEHLEALDRALSQRGGLGGIALTHDHSDHTEAVPAVRERHPGAPVAGARGSVDVRLTEGDGFGPLVALSVPGHAPDHIVYLWDEVAFTGDAVLGEGSVFISPDPGA